MSNLPGPHPSFRTCQTKNYGLFYFHHAKLAVFCEDLKCHEYLLYLKFGLTIKHNSYTTI